MLDDVLQAFNCVITLLSDNRNFRCFIKLEIGEAFVIGIVSKIIATVVTYPLVRAKVIMMTERQEDDSVSSPSDSSLEPSASCTSDHEENRCCPNSVSANRENKVIKQSLSGSPTSDALRMAKVLYTLAVLDGISGLYKGVFLHISHSTLRGALSMAMKEKINEVLLGKMK